MNSRIRQLRPLLVLGRVSNLPTVWSNCLAAWLLSGGHFSARCWLLGGGATLLYTGGMLLNDAFDVEFDRQHRAERPIPAGQISVRTVWWLGSLGLLGGWLLLVPFGARAAGFALALLGAIVLYDAVHKRTPLAPVIMAACRWLLYLVAGAAAANQVGSAVVWHGLALAIYVAGLSCLARGESNHTFVGRWPLGLLLAPVVANGLIDPQRTIASWLVAAGLLAWGIWCVRGILGGANRSVGRSIPGLLAGIVLVDWATVANPTPGVHLTFMALFLFTLMGQRSIPAS